MFKFISQKTQMVLAVTCIAIVLIFSQSQAHALPPGPTAEYFEALNEASSLKSQANNIATNISNYTIPAYYCEPPLMPQKPLAKRALDRLGTQKRSIERKASALSYIAVAASVSEYASNYSAQIYQVLEAQIIMANAANMLDDKNTQHRDTPIVDCSDLTPASNAALPSPQPVDGLSVANLIQDWEKQAERLKIKADGFTIHWFYCIPPEKPNKTDAEARLNSLMKLVRYQKNRLDILDMHEASRDYTLRDTKYLLMMAKHILQNKMDELKAKPVRECKKTKTSHYLPSETPSGPSQDELKYALGNAMGNSPYSQARVVALPSGTTSSTDILYDAEQASHRRVTDMYRYDRWQQIHERDRDPHVSTTSGTTDTPSVTEEASEPITITAEPTPIETPLETPLVSLDTPSKDLPEYETGYPITYEPINQVNTSIGSEVSIPLVTGDKYKTVEPVFYELYNPLGIPSVNSETSQPIEPAFNEINTPLGIAPSASEPYAPVAPLSSRVLYTEPLPTNTLD